MSPKDASFCSTIQIIEKNYRFNLAHKSIILHIKACVIVSQKYKPQHEGLTYAVSHRSSSIFSKFYLKQKLLGKP
ncbi:hypothetical protein H1P_810006 [Hyella patelloides LEGE 07179]|uniref:Uncharacterized protein n=1 Tax=Hyella patelloides LEGE 07179 TaxID=945734 RepID=A0A563W4D6_9CYAN|nr:hypothetical protein [Hyella patelloides]VEP18544.1 hypothetical protein H1P_810006 [Hyella patelloides LEGE 07179]